MAASSSSNVKPPPLSYAERARRAGASTTPQVPLRARPAGLNGKTRSGDESTSPASSSRNLTPNSSAALTLPGSPPPSSSQTSVDEQQNFPPMPKSTSKPVTTNVWVVRKEQLVRTSGQQHGRASAPTATENVSLQSSTVTNRMPVNGINASSKQDDSTSADHDPFVVRIPPHGHARVPPTSRSPPSLDDEENWPEMGKGGPSTSTSVSGSVVDMEKKDGPSKKGEKTKWVQIPPAELQATHDALAAQSAASSRAHSQHRRNNQAKSRSRHQSQARAPHNQIQTQNRSQNQGQNFPTSMSNGSSGASRPGEVSIAQSRTESVTHSRTTSVHSSPRFTTRGRRLPEEHTFSTNMTVKVEACQGNASNRFLNGLPVPEEHSVMTQPSANQTSLPVQPTYQDNSSLTFTVAQSLSGPHSQSHTPYSHSPVYYPPPSSGSQGYTYGSIPPSSAYSIPPPVPSPVSSGASMHQQGFVGYAYSLPQHLPPGQSPFPYMYQPVPFQYYPAHMPDQQREAQLQQQQDDVRPVVQLSPVLPPASTMTRPPPPEESGPLSGYRTIAPVPVSPLLGASAPRLSISEVVESGNDMVFGSVGQPGGLKSPSPVPVVFAAGSSEQENKKKPVTFAVGFEGPMTIRVRRSASGKNVVEDVADAIKVIDLTDKGSKWEFGTSTFHEGEALSGEVGEQRIDTCDQSQGVQQQSESQILQPQPHHMLQYAPQNTPPAFQLGGYNMGPQMHLHVPSLPIPSQSPPGSGQPLPSHVPSLVPLPVNPGFVSPLALSSPGPAPQSSGPVSVPIMGVPSGDEWEVRDFGYGFGPMSGSGYIPERLREERYERDNYRDPRENFRELRDFNGPGGGGFVPGRMRRSSTGGGYGYYEGGRGFGGRRGRGQNGYGRGIVRGGFGGRGGHGNFQRHQPSLSVATGPFQNQQNMQQPQPQQQQVSPDMPNPNGYFGSPTTTASQYISSPYGQFNPAFVPPSSQSQSMQQPQTQPLQQQQPQAPPVPVPVTALSFPLDPTRLYLLGQLEYYFSLQNLASDFFLRKQMDSRGWIPINLIASFNRVRQLTQDPQLVKEVLGISSLLEVRDDHVRLNNHQWTSFVLPGAAASSVEGEETPAVQPASNEEAEKETEEGEEDDVVFILGGEESRPWTGAT